MSGADADTTRKQPSVSSPSDQNESQAGEPKAAAAAAAAAASAQDSRNQMQHDMHPVTWCFFMACIVSGPFLFGFDLFVVGNLQPRILQTLGEVSKLPWISVSYALTGMSCAPLFGRLYMLFNIKYVFWVSLVLFEVGFALSGAAPDMNTFIGGRALSGLGAIGTYMGSMNTIAAVTTIKQRPVYVSFITFAYGLSIILAPLVGGAFADSSSTWRWAFYFPMCISALFVPGYVFLFPSKEYLPKTVTLKQRFGMLDVVGNILWAGATCSLLMAISFGGALWPWDDARIIALFCCSGVLWILFGLQQFFTIATSEQFRIFPLQFLKSLEMSLLFAQTGLAASVGIVPIFLMPIYFEFARGFSALSAGVFLLPMLIVRSVFVLVSGFGMRRTGHVMPWYLVGAVFCLAGASPFLAMTPSQPTGLFYGLGVLIGIGVGMYAQAGFAVAQARTAPSQVPQAVAFITIGQATATALSLAVSSSVFLNRATHLISDVLPGVSVGQVQRAVLGGLSAGLDGDSPEQRRQVIGAIVRAINETWACIVAAAALSIILAVFQKQERLFRS